MATRRNDLGELKPRARRSFKKSRSVAGLTPLQLAFIDEYLRDMNGPAAVVRAGYKAKEPNKQAAALLAVDVIADEIERRVKVRADAAAISTADVLKQLHAVVFLDVGELVDEKNCLRPIRKLPEHVRRALSGFELVTINGMVTAIKPVPASKAKHTELLMKHLGMLDAKGNGKGDLSQVSININYGAPAAQARGSVIDANRIEISLPVSKG